MNQQCGGLARGWREALEGDDQAFGVLDIGTLILWRNRALRQHGPEYSEWQTVLEEEIISPEERRRYNDVLSRCLKIGTLEVLSLQHQAGPQTLAMLRSRCRRCPRRCGVVISLVASDEPISSPLPAQAAP